MIKIQNIDVRFSASSNFAAVKGDLAALQAQAAALAGVFKSSAYARPPALVDPTAWKASTNAVHQASAAYRNAASSSGLFNTQQIRATSEAEKYTKALQKQKLSLGDMRKHAGIMREVYRDQLRMQRMTVQYWGTDSAGRAITDIAVPKSVPRDLDTMRNRMGMFSAMARSAGKEMVNLGKNIQWAGRQLTVGFSYPVALFGVGAGVMAYKVDEAMTRITKVYDVSLAASKDEALRQKELGKVREDSWKLSASAAKEYGSAVTDTLEIAQRLAATGLNGKELMDSTKQAARISALGDLEAGSASDMTVSLQNAFKIHGKELKETFDYMNAVENATSLSIQDIAEMIPRAASAMAALNVDAKQATVLMTSMREAGVDAAEGANALKSATGTILSPSPAAIKFVESIAGGKVAEGIANLRNTSGGNLYEAMHQLEMLTENLSKTDRQAVLVKLFGKYQFNRVSAMIENIGGAWKGTQNQTRKAMDLMSEDMNALGKMADRELGEKMNSASGKFKAAWEQFRIELAQMGGPFLEAATKILQVFVKIGKGFNDMPDWAKKSVMVGAAILALAGPVIMIGGLVANLTGHFIKGVGAVGGFLTKFRIFTTEEMAAARTTELTNKTLMGQQTVMQNLAREVQVLAAAYAEATAAARGFALSQGAAVGRNGVPVAGGGYASAPGFIGPQLPVNPTTGLPMTSQFYQNYRASERVPKGQPGAGQFRSEKERLARAEAMTREQERQYQARQKEQRLAERQQKTQDRIRNSVNGTTVAMGAGAIAMGTMMLGAEGTAASVAKMVLIGSIVLPAAIALVRATAEAAKNAWLYAAGMAAGAKAGAAGASTSGFVAKNLLIGAGKFLTSATGIVTVVAAVGGGLYLWKKHLDGARDSAQALSNAQKKGQAALLDSTKRWAEYTGQAHANYVKYNEEGKKDANNKKAMSRDESIKFYNEETDDSTVNGKKKSVSVIDQFNSKNFSQNEKDFTLEKKVVELLHMGKNIEEVRTELEAFLIASGKGLGEASVLIDATLSKIGSSVGDIDWTEYAAKAFAAWSDAADNPIFRQKVMSSIGESMASALDGLKTPEAKQKYIDFIRTNVMGGYEDVLADMKALFEKAGGLDLIMNDKDGYDKEKSLLRPLLEDVDKLRSMSFDNDKILEMSKALRDVLTLGKMGTNGLTYTHEVSALATALRGLTSNERDLFGAAGKAFNFDASIDSMNHFYSQFAIKLQTAEDDAQRMAMLVGSNNLHLQTLMTMPLGDNSPISKAIREWESVNKISGETIADIKVGLSQIDISALPQWIINFLHEIENADPSIDFNVDADDIDAAKDKLDSIPTSLNIKLNVTGEQIPGIIRDSMSNVQNEMAESATDKFNSGWDSRMDGVQASQKAAQDAFDNRWENRKDAVEKYYERREKLIQKEIKAEERADTIRQRLFDRERTRLQRLAELANQDIDFNQAVTEGRLDDAAKIGNDAQAKNAVNAMDDEQKSAEERSADRRERLEKRIEALNGRREKQLKRLDKIQERMRQHMERAQQAQIAGLERQRAAEEASLQDRLELFKSYTARNQKDLERWMKKVGLSYDSFGIGVRARGESWSRHFGDRMKFHMRKAGTEIANDNAWEEVATGVSNQLLKGMGFKNRKQFNKFLNSTVTPFEETRHTGGVIGSGGGSRGSIPNTYKGLHRSETLVRAQKGEYMVNRKDASKNKGILDAINSGTDMGGIGGGLGLTNIGVNKGDSGYGGPIGLMMAAAAGAFMNGVQQTIRVGNNNAKTAAGNNRGQAYTGKAFGAWSSEQIQNAAIIASVGGKMGMTGRDLMIGIMTAITESGLRNINYGDRDSVGLFQQRTSQGWGSIEQIMNPNYAARKFFEGLRGVDNRSSMAPWMAAQAVQRSFDPTGSNYQKYWKDANNIFKKGLKAANAGGSAGVGGFVAGAGGRHRPISGAVTSGLHGGSTAGNPPAVDMAGPSGRPVYAVADGVITQSRDIAGPLTTDRYRGSGPYGSFGRMIAMQTAGGSTVLYAHLSKRSVVAGQKVKGGSRIGLSGNTGNSSGPHLHFGATNGPYAWLRTGGSIRHDNTPAILHKGETVLTSSLTRKFKDNVASGGSDRYDITIDLRGAAIHEEIDIERAVNRAIDARESKRGRSRKVTD